MSSSSQQQANKLRVQFCVKQAFFLINFSLLKDYHLLSYTSRNHINHHSIQGKHYQNRREHNKKKKHTQEEIHIVQ